MQKLFHNPTRLGVTFDDDRAVAGAGLALVATLSKQLGTFKLANELIDLGGVPGHATPGRKVLTVNTPHVIKRKMPKWHVKRSWHAEWIQPAGPPMATIRSP